MATAAALVRAGYEPTVFERAPSDAAEGIFLSVFPNGLRFLGALDPSLATEIEQLGIEQHAACVRTHQGQVIAERAIDFRERFGLPLIGIAWSALHRALRARVPSSIVRMGVGVTSVSLGKSEITATFSDGTSRPFDLLVAADGVRSTLRSLFADDAPSYAGRVSARALVPSSAGASAHGVSMDKERGHTFASGSLADGRVFWNAMINAKADVLPSEPEAAKRTLLSIYESFHEYARGLIAETPAASILCRPILVRPPLATMHRGRCVIVGDAAHAMQISTGQGANLAIEEGVDLALCLAQHDTVEGALATFDARRVERAQLIHARNTMVSNAAHSTEGHSLMKGIIERARMDELEFQRFLHTYEPFGRFNEPSSHPA